MKLGKDNLTFTFMLGTIIVIFVMMGLKFWWDYTQQQKQMQNELLEKAQVITQQQKAVWEFMIINQDRINYDAQGNFEFKHLNCSTVAMGVGVIFAEMTDYTIKPTNIDYRNALNAPDKFELAALNKFKADSELQEFWAITTVNGDKVFRYLSPLIIDETCLSCHGEPQGEYDISGYQKEGYELGSLGGAISLTMPMDISIQNIKANLISNAVFFLVLMLACIIIIYFLATRLVIRSLGELEGAVGEVGRGNLNINLSNLKARGEIKRLANHFQHMTNQLRDLYNNLEQKVENRTRELQKANKILERHQFELEEANKKLQEANKFKSEFLALMSHELRTPLTSVIAFTEILSSEVGPRAEKTQHYLEEIKTSSHVLLGLINNILEMAKIEAGKSSLQIETVDLTDVIASVEAVAMPLALRKNISLKIKISPGIPLIKADPEKLRSVVENLVGNALKFTANNGQVEIMADYSPQDNLALLKVQDTGIGIKEEELKFIFEKFTQADSSTSRKYGGTGLGLALTKEFIELHNGWIKVDSIVNQGTTFTVGLPCGDINPGVMGE
ncbi:MAG: c-type heme family protein [Desulfitobacteriia bacterium]